MSSNSRPSAPYKGPDSYQVEDAALFFGRAPEAEELVARILSSRITLLHAQSGAGKTSLLNSLVIPALEEKGWIPVRVLPQNDPVMSTWVSTIGYVLPPLRAEYLAAKRIYDELRGADENPTLGDLLWLYDQLPVRDARKRSLIAPIQAGEMDDVPEFIQCANFTPYLCRLFRSTCDLETLAEHLGVVLAYSAAETSKLCDLSEQTRICDLLSFLSDHETAKAYDRLLTALNVPTPRLRALLENLAEVYGKLRSRFSLVILLDQFEEIFTRFVDLGSLSRFRHDEFPDWRLKYEFFGQLRDLYRINEGVPTEASRIFSALPEPDALPIRYVISMRSEYIAQLDPVREFAPEIDVSSFRLALLDPQGAQLAIRAPAREYGFDYTAECYREIVTELTKEDRFVEPAHVQIICEKLWTEQGRLLSEETIASGAGKGQQQIPEIGVEVYRDQLRGAKGIMTAFLRDFLDALDEAERLETLELLEPLITGSGTRNIVERDALITAPFRPREHRERLLANLVARTIVRVETRLGGQFAEITHEFLIPPIRDAMQKELYADVDFTRCRLALRTLGRLQADYQPKDAAELMALIDFDLLNKYRQRVEWNAWGIDVMFRLAVRIGAARENILYWARQVEHVRSLPSALGRLMPDSVPTQPTAEGAADATSWEAVGEPLVSHEFSRTEAVCLSGQSQLCQTPNNHPVTEHAIAIVRDGLASRDVNLQNNAVRALGALQSAEAAEILVAAALGQQHGNLEDVARKELLELEPGEDAAVVGVLNRRLVDPRDKKYVYALLGRLRRAGSGIEVSSPKGLSGLNLGMSLFSVLYPKDQRKPWKRSLGAAAYGGFVVGLMFIGGLLGVSTLLPFFGVLVKGDNGSLMVISLGSYAYISLLGMLIAPVISRRSSPITLHFDRKLGLMSEILWSALYSMWVSGFLGALIGLSALSHSESSPLVSVLLFCFCVIGTMLVFAVPVAVVRYGTILPLLRGWSRPSRFTRSVVGTATGLGLAAALGGIVATVVHLFGGKNTEAIFVLLTTSIMLAPLLSSIASAFAAIDDEEVVKA